MERKVITVSKDEDWKDLIPAVQTIRSCSREEAVKWLKSNDNAIAVTDSFEMFGWVVLTLLRYNILPQVDGKQLRRKRAEIIDSELSFLANQQK